MATEQEKISVDGTLTTLDKANLNIKVLLGHTLLYTTINTLNYKPLHLGRKLEYLTESYKALYGINPKGITTKSIAKEIHDLLYFGFYPESGNIVSLYLLPPQNGVTQRVIIHEATTPYSGYELLSIRPTATIAKYDLPLERHRTTISLSSAHFTDIYAQSRTQSIALRANRENVLLSSGDNPLFAVRGTTLLTAPLQEGGRNSVERELMFRLAEIAGVRVIEESPVVDDIEEYDEIMIMTPAGIQSIYSVGGVVLENIYATMLSRHIEKLTREGVAL